MYLTFIWNVSIELISPKKNMMDYYQERLVFSKKQLVRAIKELTINNAVIVQTFKGRKGNCSKYFLTRFEEQNKEQKKVHSSRYNI